MATTKQLTEAVSRATGFSVETVHVHMRNLRERGLLTQAGKGSSAARMTPRDAARLLIAVCGAYYVKESADAVVTFAALPAYRRELISPKERIIPVSIAPHWIEGPRHWSAGHTLRSDLNGEAVRSRFGLNRIQLGASFEDALVAVIEAVLTYTLFPRLQPTDFRKPPSKMPDYRKRLWVTHYRPQAYASITYCAESITYEKILFQRKQPENIFNFIDSAKHKRQAFLYREIDFNEETLEIICEALVSEEGIPVNRSRRKAAHVS
ncbi:MAG: hypothetical protein ACRDHZ_04015 [Ktedonobacteraceae bacterium]